MAILGVRVRSCNGRALLNAEVELGFCIFGRRCWRCVCVGVEVDIVRLGVGVVMEVGLLGVKPGRSLFGAAADLNEVLRMGSESLLTAVTIYTVNSVCTVW